MERNELEEEARKKWNPTRFGRELGQRQIVGKKDRRGNKVRRGIKLRGSGPLLGNQGASQAGAVAGSAEPTRDNLGWPDDDDDVFGGRS